MKYLPFFLILLALVTRACALDFSPPPLQTTPQAVAASQVPFVILATPTLTAIPPTETLPPPTETAAAQPEPATQTPTPLEESPTPLVETPTPANPILTVEQLRNATLTIMGSDQILRSITLKDGGYASDPDPAAPGYIEVKLTDQIAFGDLNGDGFLDAAIIIAESFGGTGTFISTVAILNQNGQPEAAATALIEDRAIINEIAVRDGGIFVDAIIHGPNDPLCCAAMPSKRFYRLNGNDLTLTQLSSTTPTGQERIIQIDSPANETEISSPFLIQGSVSVSPFENTLVYYVYAKDNPTPLAQAGFTISGDGLGGPGSFELPIDPARYNWNGPVRIVIADSSAADGSLLALSSIFVNFK